MKKNIALFLCGLFLNNFIYSQNATLEATFSLADVDGIKIPYQNGTVLPTFEKQKRTIQNLAGVWKKQRFNANDYISLSKRNAGGYNNLLNEAASRQLTSYNDAGWESKQLPAVENSMHTFPQPPELLPNPTQPAGVWYRKTFQVDVANSGKFTKLIFYAINYVADVWLNGHYLGYHEGGYTSFAFDVSSKLIYGGPNVIAVRIDNPAWGTRTDIVPYVTCDWFNYSGMIHDVYLEFSDQISIARADIVPKDIDGSIQTTIVLQNKNHSDQNVDLKIEVFEADINPFNIKTEIAANLIGAPVSITGISNFSLQLLKDSVKVFRTNLKVVKPKLWTPKEPNLYIMKVFVYQSGMLKDEYSTQFGIRTITQSGSKVFLNGKPIFLTGVARHEDHPIYGRSIPVDTIYSDLLKVQSMNANLLRSAHYPNHPFTYLITDRLGIVVIEEIPVWWFDDAQSWQYQNNVRHIHEQMFREMVFRDYNRSSIFFWSTCNECKDVANRKTFIQKVNDDLNNNFPDGRLITQSAAADRPGPNDGSQSATDIAGWTMYFGIFHGSTYYDGTKNFLESATAKYPNKPILDTEFGYWSTENPTSASYKSQTTVFNDTFKAFKEKAALNPDGTVNDNGYMLGTTWWCIFDWYQYKDTYNSYQTMGLMSMNRGKIKPVGTILKTAYAPYFNIGGVTTSVQEKKSNQIPATFNLMQNYPNPFNPSTVINYQLSAFGYVSLKVFDLLGKEVATLVDEFKQPGNYNSTFSIMNYTLPSGIYFYKLQAGNLLSTKKMLLIK